MLKLREQILSMLNLNIKSKILQFLQELIISMIQTAAEVIKAKVITIIKLIGLFTIQLQINNFTNQTIVSTIHNFKVMNPLNSLNKLLMGLM